LRQLPLPTYAALRIIGIDDRALRRGHRFGRIVADLERQRPIALAPKRQPETVIAWLRQHPTAHIVSRARADGYADAIRRGARQARQVADRGHLLKHRTETAQRSLRNKHPALQAAVPPSEPSAAALAAVPVPPAEELARPRTNKAAQQRYREQCRAIPALHAQPPEIATIARQGDVSPATRGLAPSS
jgi:transposase